MKFIFHPHARAEFHDAVQWYVSRESGVGVRFARQFRTLAKRIKDNPLMYAVDEDHGARVCIVDRFPYSINYLINSSNKIWIAADAHTKRRPHYWLYRLDDR